MIAVHARPGGARPGGARPGGGVAEERPPLPTVATVGFFDGLHLGHQKVLADLVRKAREAGAAPAVVTFDRHPQEVLSTRPPVNLSSLNHRLVLLSRSGVEWALVLPFDREVASWSPEDFVRVVLREALRARELYLGFDSALGKGRRGTFEYLKAREGELGISVRRGEPLLVDGVRVSSTLVREAVLAGDLERLRALLGRSYSVLGQVVPGDGRGRRIGFPTANLDLEGQFLLPPGVYFAEGEVVSLPARPGPVQEVSPERGPALPAVVNIGRRPTFGGEHGRPVVEAHLLDFEGDLYGRDLEVRFLHRRREERRFSGPDELVVEIRRDIEARRAFR